MKCKMIALIFMCVMICGGVPVCAEEPVFGVKRHIVDEADLVSEEMEVELDDRMSALAEQYGLDSVIVLLNDYEAYSTGTPEEFAINWYQAWDYGYDEEHSGILLLISMAERDWHIYIQGEARVAVNDYGYEYISERLVETLGEDQYQQGIEDYVGDLELFFEAYGQGEPYGTDHTVKTFEDIIGTFGMAVVLSVVISFIIVTFMKKGMNSARPQMYAREYVRDGSFVLTNQQDLYLYSNVTKTKIQKSSGSSGGGGRSGSRGGSGGGGKF